MQKNNPINKTFKKTTKFKKRIKNKKKDNHNKVTKITSKMSNLLNAPKLRENTYESAILLPEYARNAKIPRQLGQITISFHRHVTIPLSVDFLTGQANFVWNPNFLNDNSTDLSTIFYTSAGYNAIAGTGNGVSLAQTWSVPASNVRSYRIVSASCILMPQSSTLLQQGKITGAIIDEAIGVPVAAGSAYTPSIIGKLSSLDNVQNCSIANVAEGKGVRLIYTPIDVQDFSLWPINSNESSDVANTLQPCFTFIITGCPLSTGTVTPFVAELYINFEVVPLVTSILVGLGDKCQERTNPLDILEHVKENPRLLSHVMGSDMNSALVNANLAVADRNAKFLKKQGGIDKFINSNSKQYYGWNTEYHYPGTNFLGPGTNIVERIERGDKPTSYIDNIARSHDIDYLIAAGNPYKAAVADVKAMVMAFPSMSLQSIAMRVGLGLRLTTNLLTLGQYANFNESINGKTDLETQIIGERLKQQLN